MEAHRARAVGARDEGSRLGEGEAEQTARRAVRLRYTASASATPTPTTPAPAVVKGVFRGAHVEVHGEDDEEPTGTLTLAAR